MSPSNVTCGVLRLENRKVVGDEGFFGNFYKWNICGAIGLGNNALVLFVFLLLLIPLTILWHFLII